MTPDPGVPAGGEDDRIGMDKEARTVGQPETECAEYAVVGDEYPRHIDVVEDRNLQFGCTHDEGALNLKTRIVAPKSRSAVGVCAEEPLADASIVFPGKLHTVALKITDAIGCALGDDFDRPGVGEAVAFTDRVGRMLLPAVLGVHRAQCRIDPTGGQRGVRVVF